MESSVKIDHTHYKAGLLLDFYGQLLPARAREVLESYYYEDLTLAEIASLLKISRQGVHDRLQQGLASLQKYEDKLGLVSHYGQLKELLGSAIGQLDQGDLAAARKTLAELKQAL